MRRTFLMGLITPPVLAINFCDANSGVKGKVKVKDTYT